MKTYSEEDHQAAVAEAVQKAKAELQSKFDKTGHQRTSDLDASIADLTAQNAKLQSQLDEKVLEAKTASDELEALNAARAEAEAEAVREAEISKLRDERTAAVAAVIEFPDDHVAASADRWALMDADAFAAQIAEYTLLAAKGPPRTAPAVLRTAMTAADEQGHAEGGRFSSLAREVLELRNSGVDMRTV